MPVNGPTLPRRGLLALLAALPAALQAAGPPLQPLLPATPWAELLPPGWNPQKFIDGLGLDRMDDGDPAAGEALKKLRAAWDAAPANPGLDRRRVRLQGYMVPLDADREHIRQFLLVPYFGACIHAPAPPANQVVLVVPQRPFPTADRGTSAVWVTGPLSLQRSDSELGAASYRMAAELVEPYKP